MKKKVACLEVINFLDLKEDFDYIPWEVLHKYLSNFP